MSNGILSQEGRIASFIPPKGVDLFLKAMTGREELGRPFQFELELLSEDFEIDFDKVLGKQVTVCLNLSSGGPRYFNGFISQFIQSAPEEDFASYRATLVPWLWLLTRRVDSRIFQPTDDSTEMTVLDILPKVFPDFQELYDDTRLKHKPYPKWENCVQYRETDFNFVSRLLEHEGIAYFFEHQKDKHTLVLADDPASHQPYDGYSEIKFLPVRGGGDAEYIRDWIAQKRLLSGKYALSDFNPEQPDRQFLAQNAIVRSHDHADSEIHDYPGDFADCDPEDGAGDRYAVIRTQEIQARHETFVGESDARGICVGCKFTLKNHPKKDPDPEFLVCSAEHLIRQNPYKAGFAATGSEDSYRCSFTAIRANQTFRPPRVSPKPQIRGLQTAIVVGPEKEEIHTDEHGRVRVHFHWDRHHEKRSDNFFPEDSSCWMRVSHAWAGENWGAMFLPRVGQEVIVEFLEGDPDCPLITGRVYNGTHKVPYTLPANKTQSGIKTRRSKDGTPENCNEIQFEDKKGEEKINIHAEKDLSVSVENNKSESVQGNKSISVDGTHTETVKKDTKITITEGFYEHKVAANTAKHTANKEIQIISETAHIHVTAATEIQLKVGGSILLMKNDGTIKLTGTNIAIDGKESLNMHGGTVTSEATTHLQITGATVVSEASATNTIIGKAAVMLNPT